MVSYPTKFELRDRESDLRVKSSTYYRKLDKIVANITLEDDTNTESIHKEIENTEYEAEGEGEATRRAKRVICLLL